MWLVLFAAAFMLLLVRVRAKAEAAEPTPTGGGEAEFTLEDIEAEVRARSEQTELEGWQEYFEQLRALSKTAGGYDTASDFVEAIALDGANIQPGSVFGCLSELFLPGLKSAVRELAWIAAVAGITWLLSLIFKNGETKELVLLVAGSSAILGITAVFSRLAGKTTALIGDVGAFCELCAPVMGTLLTAMGGAASAKLLSPTLLFIADGVVSLMRGVVVPMLLASGVLTVLNGLTEGLKLERSVKFLHKTVKWLLGVAGAVYSGGAIIAGIGANSADGISVKTAKFAIDKLIPAAGGMAGGAVDAVRAGSALLKNAAGTASVLIIAAVAVRPLIELACGMLALRLTAAVVEPFADERIPKMLDGIAETVSLLFSAAAATAAMFAVVITVMIFAGSSIVGA